jgi:hypothetical protein
MTSTSVGLVALRVPFTVVGLAAGDADDFRALWRPCLVEEVSHDALQVVVLRTPGGWRAEVADLHWDLAGGDAAVAAASAAVNTAATSRTPLLATHAAVVAKNGVTAVIPGASGSRKSTLALALLGRGWSYTSDEAFALDRASGEPCHYARPTAASDWTLDRLGLAGRGRPSAGETYLVPTDLGASYQLAPVVPDLVVLRSREEDATSLTEVHRMDGLEALLRRSFTTHVDPAGGLRLMAEVTRRCEVVRLSGSDPAAAAERLDTLAG